MKKRNFPKRVIAIILAAVSVSSVATMTITSAHAVDTDTSVVSQAVNAVAKKESIFMSLLQKALTKGASKGTSAALKPLLNTIGCDLLGIDANADLARIRERLDEIDGKLDDIKEKISDGFDKVLSEMDKNNKLRNVLDALAKSEAIADRIMSTDKTLELVGATDWNDLTPEQQRQIVEINADIINHEDISALYSNLQLVNAYMTSGLIDTNYNSVYDVYYSYMKKQSMFCGEAANKAEPFWEIMKESYAKSSIALIYALEQQKSLHLLSNSTPTAEISQEAIDAASVAKTFGTLNVIERKIAKVTADSEKFIEKYNSFIEKVSGESTVFINKDTTYIELKPELGNVNISNGKTYQEYTYYNNFENDGLNEKIYNSVVEQGSRYTYVDNFKNFGILRLNTLSYNDFIKNSGSCKTDVRYTYNNNTRYQTRTEDFKNISWYVFKDIMLSMKAERFNTANKLENENVEAIIKHINENYDTYTISSYLESVGFNLSNMKNNCKTLLPTGDLSVHKISSNKDLYDVNSLGKKHDKFENLVDSSNPAGNLMFFEKAQNSIDVTLKARSMNGRVHNGVYTISGMQIVRYDANNTPVYRYYEKTYDLNGTNTQHIKLPSNIDYKTLEITLGYEGLLASSNHKNICSYSFKNETKPFSDITLELKGYTKAWLGYGVDGKISCDGRVVAEGHD